MRGIRRPSLQRICDIVRIQLKVSRFQPSIALPKGIGDKSNKPSSVQGSLLPVSQIACLPKGIGDTKNSSPTLNRKNGSK
jgi:hypothetical protein